MVRRKSLLIIVALLLLAGLFQLLLSNKLFQSKAAVTDYDIQILEQKIHKEKLLLNTTESCDLNKPCQYDDSVDLRIIVMVFDRALSLQKVLNSLQELKLDGDSGAVEIWIDRSKSDQSFHIETLKVAKEFIWKHGVSRVHVHKQHVGIYGQWIDTWRPKPNSKELALFLEDDVDVSPYAYRWLKAAYNKYRPSRRIGCYALYEGAIVNMKGDLYPVNQTVFLHQRMGSQGMTPDADHWRDFQDWYHKVLTDKNFHPYVTRDPQITSWYKDFEKRNHADSMWSIWYIFYNDKHNLYTLYPNLWRFQQHKNPTAEAQQYLAFHRKEKGLHFKGKPSKSTNKLILSWSDTFLDLPDGDKLQKVSYSGKIIK